MKRSVTIKDIVNFAQLDMIYNQVRMIEAKQNESEYKCLGSGKCCHIGLVIPMLECANIAFRLNQRQIPRIQSLAYLALGGSGLYIASVLIAGFGYGYKAVFLLLAIPLISRFTAHQDRAVVIFSITVLRLIALQSVVVWNSAMVTVAGVIASAGAAGIAAGVAFRGSRFGDSNKGKNPSGIATP